MSRFPVAEVPFFAARDRAIAAHVPPYDRFLPPIMEEASLRQQVVARREQYTLRPVLRQLIERQYAGVDLPPALQANITALGQDPDTYCVVTAHQPLLFGGKGYFLYKALTAIRLAAYATRILGDARVVPVFVLGSEDHDYEEVRHLPVFQHTLSWTSDGEGPVGRRAAGNIPQLLNELEQAIQGLAYAGDVMDLLRSAHREGETFARSAFRLLHQLLGDKGLIVLDLDDVEAKRAFLPVMREELLHQLARKEVDQTLQLMAEEGIREQAHGRDVNLFYLGDTFRHRLERRADGTFAAVDTSLQWTEAALLAELDAHPERFSPNVLLRPIYQQSILPGLVFTGGGGELAYWMQLGRLFRRVGLPYPLLARRDSVLLLDGTSRQRMQKLHVGPETLLQPLEDWIRDFVARQVESEASLDISQEKEALQQILRRIGEKCAAIDPTLERSFASTEAGVLKQLEGLEARMVRGIKHQHEDTIQQLRNLHGRLFPNGQLQERHDAFVLWIARYGTGWIDALLGAIDPRQPSLLLYAMEEAPRD